MTKKNKTQKTLVERHALNRLGKVQEDKQKAYEKKPHLFNWKQFMMVIMFILILAIMISSIIK